MKKKKRFVCSTFWSTASFSGKLNVVKAALRQGAHLGFRFVKRESFTVTVLCVSLLLFSYRDTRGRTALHYAVFGDSLLVVKYLVERILALQGLPLVRFEGFCATLSCFACLEDVMKENCPPVALSDPQDKGNNLLDAPVNCYTEVC